MSKAKFRREPWRFRFVMLNGIGVWNVYSSFGEAMKRGEGWNIPHLEVDGVREPFKHAYARVKRWWKFKSKM